LKYLIGICPLFHSEHRSLTSISTTTPPGLFSFFQNNKISKILEGPIPVPSFREYVTASRAISNAIGVEGLPKVFSDSSFGYKWGNLLTLGTIHISPNNHVSYSFLEYLNVTYPDLLLVLRDNYTDDNEAARNGTTTAASSLIVRLHISETDALRYIDTHLLERTWALLDFTGQDSFMIQDDNLEYKIRMNYTTVPNTNEVTDWVSIGLNTDYQSYYLSGYLTLQRTINEFAFSRSGDCLDQMGGNLGFLWSLPMPTAAYSQNPFFLEVGYLLGLTIVMAFLYPTSRLIKTIVEEKETKMRETLYILGVHGWAYWWSWLLTAFSTFAIITMSVTFALTSTLVHYSNPAYIFAFVGLFSTANVGFCFTVAALFSRAKLSAIIGPIALFGTILPRFIFFGFNRYEATTSKIWVSLFPATAFAFGADILGDYEYSQQGIQSWNAGEGEYSFHTTLRLLFFDTLLYMFLGWYFDQVIPRQYGAARPFYFLLTPCFWCSFYPRMGKMGPTYEGAVPPEKVVER
jgi:hypothetical protein